MTRESGYYPPGAEHDPNAPWNQPDPVDCPECGGTGTTIDLTATGPEDREYPCYRCDGTGVVDPGDIEEEGYEEDYE